MREKLIFALFCKLEKEKCFEMIIDQRIYEEIQRNILGVYGDKVKGIMSQRKKPNDDPYKQLSFPFPHGDDITAINLAQQHDAWIVSNDNDFFYKDDSMRENLANMTPPVYALKVDEFGANVIQTQTDKAIKAIREHRIIIKFERPGYSASDYLNDLIKYEYENIAAEVEIHLDEI